MPLHVAAFGNQVGAMQLLRVNCDTILMLINEGADVHQSDGLTAQASHTRQPATRRIDLAQSAQRTQQQNHHQQ